MRITEGGRKVLLHLALGTKEDTSSCTAFLEDLKRRGLPDPLPVVSSTIVLIKTSVGAAGRAGSLPQ